jgi:hypothetical protein
LITSREIEKYKKLNVPLPRDSYEERIESRAKKLGPLTLKEIPCASSGNQLQSVYREKEHIIWDKDIFEQKYFS